MSSPGQQLSHYRLSEKIGQGGMGEVWKAMDTRLDREVAVKFLPDAVTHDPDRLERFAREAKFLAALNHPGIATIHDIDEDQGVRFLVMELVPGQDLSQRLDAGPVPLDESLDIALQVALAIEAAHAQGVVHRDLKPANVKCTPDGKIKVLDFGLAKVMAPETSSSGSASVSMSPTMTSAGTVAGVILGTAAYMSPEQARGRPIDKRTDVWSFGVLLYELLTGDNPFRGDTVADSVGAIMHRDPDLDTLPPGTPAAVTRLLRRCLKRERAQRLHDIADVRIELEEAIAHPEAEVGVGVTPAPAPARPSRLPWIALALLVPLAALTAWWVGSRTAPPPSEAERRFKLVPDQEVDEVGLSPDGTRLAYIVGNSVFIRALDSLESRLVLDAGEEGVNSIFWSPESDSLGVTHADGKIQRLDLDGSAPTTVAQLEAFIQQPQWGDDGYIYVSSFQGGVERFPETGGAREEFLDAPEGMLDYHGIVVLPGGQGLLTLPHLASNQYRQIFHERQGEEPTLVYESDSLINGLAYSATGHLLFQRDDVPRGLWALPFSLEQMEATGPPFLVVADLREASLSTTGDLAYAQSWVNSGGRKQEIVWADRTGEIVDRLEMDLYDARPPAVSPDGSRLAVIAMGVDRPSTGEFDVWVIDLDRKSSTRLTEGGVHEIVLEWSNDGSRIAFVEKNTTPNTKERIVAIRADGTGERELLLETDISFFADLSDDWSNAAVMSGEVSSENGMDIIYQAIGDPSSAAPVVNRPGQDITPHIHPSGEWLVYSAGDFVTMETFIQPFPTGEGRWKVSTGVGVAMGWSSDGRTLYYDGSKRGDSGGRIFEVSFDASGPTPVIGKPVELFHAPDVRFAVVPAPDERFLYLRYQDVPEGEEPPDTNGIVLVENWLSRFSD